MCTLHIVHIGTPHAGVCNGIPIIEAISVLSSLVQGLRMQSTRSIGQSLNRFNTQTETYGREQIVDHFRRTRQRGSVGRPELGKGGEHPRGGSLPRHASTRAGLPAGPVLAVGLFRYSHVVTAQK